MGETRTSADLRKSRGFPVTGRSSRERRAARGPPRPFNAKNTPAISPPIRRQVGRPTFSSYSTRLLRSRYENGFDRETISQSNRPTFAYTYRA